MTAPSYYFKDAKLFMPATSRFLTRLIGYFFYALIAALTLVFLLSELKPLIATGILLALFLMNVVSHIGKSERSIAQASEKHANVRVYCEPATLRILESALDRAAMLGGDFVLHLMAHLVKRAEIAKALVRMDVKPEDLLLKIEEYTKKSSTYPFRRADAVKVCSGVVVQAFLEAKGHYGKDVEPHDLFAVLGSLKNPYVDRLLTLFEINPLDLESALLFSKAPAFNLAAFFHRTFKVRRRTMNRAWTAKPTPFLDSLSVDVTDQVRSGMSGFLVGHASEYDQMVDILSRPGNPNVILVGEPGIGKETLVHHLAAQVIKDRVPKPLFDKRIVSLEIGSLMAGAGEGEVQERVKKALNEILDSGNIILFIPDIHNLVKTSGNNTMSAADTLIPVIKGSQFSVVGATYPKEYKQYVEANNEFSSAFEAIRIEEVSEEEAVQYLVYVSLILERGFDVTISFSAVKKAVSIAHKYFRKKLLPSSAEDLLKETVADAAQQEKAVISAEDVIAIAQRKINVPLKTVGEREAASLLNLEETIHQRLVDQEEAVSAVSRALREYRSGLSRKGGPIASFLFVGPTGVGKTELSKILSEIQFGSKEAMVRFDMSEYQDKQSFFRLIGTPDGSLPGQLTDAIREKPYSLVLLDEFEKAYADVLNLFLQVFDDGRLTDSLGRTVDFSNTIIIATSNAHSPFIKEEIEKNRPISQIATELKKKLTDVFRPELLNRFSDIIVFKSLSLSDIENITRLNLKELAKTVEAAQGIALSFDVSAVRAVAKLGYDPVFGARPLRQVISQRLRSVLAEKILRGEVKKGGAFAVSFEGESFVFKPVEG